MLAVTRTRATAKDAGTRTETAVARYLAEHVDDRIERRRQSGTKDRGDLSGVRVHGKRVVVEVKDCAKLELGSWLTEAEIERGNDDAVAGLVVAKRRGKGAPGDLLVAMTLADLVALITGIRPEPECPLPPSERHGECRNPLGVRPSDPPDGSEGISGPREVSG